MPNFSDPLEGDWIKKLTSRVPSSSLLRNPPGRTGSQAQGSCNYRKRSLRRSRCEHGDVGFGSVGRSGLARGSGVSLFFGSIN